MTRAICPQSGWQPETRAEDDKCATPLRLAHAATAKRLSGAVLRGGTGVLFAEVAIAVHPPPGPREEKRTLFDYILAGLVVLALAALVAGAIWLIVSGKNIF